MDKHFSIQVDYINRIKDDPESMKAFALWLKIKKRYVNGVIFSYTPEKVADKMCVSVYEARKYVGKMISMGLAEKQYTSNETRLRIMSFRAAREKQKGGIIGRVNVHVTDKIPNVVIKLRYILLRAYLLDRQNYVSKVYADVVQLDKNKDSTVKGYKKIDRSKLEKRVKKLKKIGYDFYSPEKAEFRNVAGYRRMAFICGVSVASMKSMFVKLRNWKYIMGTSWKIEEVKGLDASVFLAMKSYYSCFKPNYWAKDNKVYKHLGTIIHL